MYDYIQMMYRCPILDVHAAVHKEYAEYNTHTLGIYIRNIHIRVGVQIIAVHKEYVIRAYSLE